MAATLFKNRLSLQNTQFDNLEHLAEEAMECALTNSDHMTSVSALVEAFCAAQDEELRTRRERLLGLKLQS